MEPKEDLKTRWQQLKPAWPGEYPDASRPSTKLYKVDDGGEYYWMSAHSPERALGLVCAYNGGPLEEWLEDPPHVMEVTVEDLATSRFTFEDGEKCRLWNAFELVRGFEVMVATTLI